MGDKRSLDQMDDPKNGMQLFEYFTLTGLPRGWAGQFPGSLMGHWSSYHTPPWVTLASCKGICNHTFQGCITKGQKPHLGASSKILLDKFLSSPSLNNASNIFQVNLCRVVQCWESIYVEDNNYVYMYPGIYEQSLHLKMSHVAGLLTVMLSLNWTYLILQPFILRPPLIIRTLKLVPKCHSVC